MILILAYISFAFLGLRLLVVLVNFVFHFSGTKPELRENPKISVLIPARNEEKNIGRILECLLEQEYKNLEVLVCNDQSTDNTPAILEKYSRRHKEIKWFEGEELKPGWTGKNFACYQLGKRARGEILLFVDADMELQGDVLGHMAAYMKKRNLALLSIFPKQMLHSAGERATVPVMNWILLSLLPLPLVIFSPRSSFSAANGQFMMFRDNVYHKLQPHHIVRSSAVEDIEIMRLYKKEGYRCATLAGDSRVSCRMYSTYREAINGFSKNVLHFFSESLLWVFFYLIFTSFGLLFIGLGLPSFFLISLSAAILGRILISLTSHQAVLRNLLLVPLQHLSFIHMLGKALLNKSKGRLMWKEREITLT
jgi:glycosyltransferase involved in cell wall biosynthesis